MLIHSCTPKVGRQLEEQKPNEKTEQQQAENEANEETPIEEEEEIEPVVEKPNEEIISGPYLVASLAKTPCYGRCPVFEVRIYSDGVVEFFGKENVNLIGHFQANADQQFVDEVIRLAKAINYNELESNYPAHGLKISDLPNVVTYVRIGNNEKSITNNHLAPQALIEFEKQLEKMINSLSYQKLE